MVGTTRRQKANKPLALNLLTIKRMLAKACHKTPD
jgi:hypothetical protein